MWPTDVQRPLRLYSNAIDMWMRLFVPCFSETFRFTGDLLVIYKYMWYFFIVRFLDICFTYRICSFQQTFQLVFRLYRDTLWCSTTKCSGYWSRISSVFPSLPWKYMRCCTLALSIYSQVMCLLWTREFVSHHCTRLFKPLYIGRLLLSSIKANTTVSSENMMMWC